MPLPLLGGGSILIVVNYKFSFTYEEIFKAYEDCIRHKKNSPNAIKFMLNKNENIIQLCDEINDRTYTIGTSIAFIIKFPKYREVFAADFSDNNEYIVHAHSSGSISIASYEQVKDIVRSFVYMSSFMTEILQPSFVFEIERRDKFDASKVCKNYEDEIARLKKIEGKYNILKKVGNIESNDDTVLGVPSSAFTEGQLKAIKATVDSVLRNLKK